MEEKGFRNEPGRDENAAARAVVGAAVEVHRILGPGYLESVYEAALCQELALRRVPFERQVPMSVRYKGVPVGDGRLDLLIESLVVVELKAVPALADIHTAQVISYLKGTGRSLGLLLNFGGVHMRTGIRRVVLTHPSLL